MMIDEEEAKIICEMALVCYSEGIGPDDHALLCRIMEAYPQLKQQYEILWK